MPSPEISASLDGATDVEISDSCDAAAVLYKVIVSGILEDFCEAGLDELIYSSPEDTGNLIDHWGYDCGWGEFTSGDEDEPAEEGILDVYVVFELVITRICLGYVAGVPVIEVDEAVETGYVRYVNDCGYATYVDSGLAQLALALAFEVILEVGDAANGATIIISTSEEEEEE